MSFRAVAHALDHVSNTPMSPSAKLVLLALANRHNQETGRCDPSLQRLAADLLLSERSVRNGLRELESLKLISTTERRLRTGRGKRNLTNRYKLRGGAKFAGRMGQNLPTNLEDRRPSHFDDLLMVVDDVEEAFENGGVSARGNVGFAGKGEGSK